MATIDEILEDKLDEAGYDVDIQPDGSWLVTKRVEDINDNFDESCCSCGCSCCDTD